MLTMRTLSLGSSSARPSSSSTTSQFRSPHLHRDGGHRSPFPSRGVQAQAAREGLRLPPEAPTAPESTCLCHLLLEEVLSFLPGEEDPGPAHQSRHQAQLPPAVTRAVSIHPAGDTPRGDRGHLLTPPGALHSPRHTGTPTLSSSARPWLAGRTSQGAHSQWCQEHSELMVWNRGQRSWGRTWDSPRAGEPPGPLSPVSPVAQLPAGPGAAVAAGFAARV